ncbi:MAG: NtrZ family periplasmic regulatory protein [Hyphomonadaceae bacterium]
MFRRSVMLLAGAVVLTAGIAAPTAALAQESAADRDARRAEVPWYERFTYNQGPSEQGVGLGPVDRRGQPTWEASQRWGVTVNLRDAERTPTVPTAQDETAVGAYYQFTPSLRVGGAVSVGAVRNPLATQTTRDAEEPNAGVRLESAFRF